MFEKIFGYPIVKTTDEEIYKLMNLPDDDYVNHNLILEATAEFEKRKISS